MASMTPDSASQPLMSTPAPSAPMAYDMYGVPQQPAMPPPYQQPPAYQQPPVYQQPPPYIPPAPAPMPAPVAANVIFGSEFVDPISIFSFFPPHSFFFSPFTQVDDVRVPGMPCHRLNKHSVPAGRHVCSAVCGSVPVWSGVWLLSDSLLRGLGQGRGPQVSQLRCCHRTLQPPVNNSVISLAMAITTTTTSLVGTLTHTCLPITFPVVSDGDDVSSLSHSNEMSCNTSTANAI